MLIALIILLFALLIWLCAVLIKFKGEKLKINLAWICTFAILFPVTYGIINFVGWIKDKDETISKLQTEKLILESEKENILLDMKYNYEQKKDLEPYYRFYHLVIPDK